MPELPEVQTVVSQLGEKLVGKTIVSVQSEWPKAIRPSLEVFDERVVGRKVLGTRRFGKHIVIDLSFSNNTDLSGSFGIPDQVRDDIFFDKFESIVIHLKMTGHLLVKTPKNRESEAFRDPYNQYLHHKIFFEDETELAFSDMRKFGWMEVSATQEVEKMKPIAALGVDALSGDLTEKVFSDLLNGCEKTAVGAFLLKQERITGIGNIYRSEALFRSGIHPLRLSGSLSASERKKLLESIRWVLLDALQFRGMSDGDFRDTDGLPGMFQKELGVYGREGAPCPKCGIIIKRIKIGQRSVFFCPSCQV